MPFIFDPSQNINMLQSSINVGLQQRQQQGQAAFAHRLKRMEATDQAFAMAGQGLGGLASKWGTAVAGGNPADPGALGQGYFNTKGAAYFSEQRNAALQSALAKQSIAISEMTQGKTGSGAALAAASKSVASLQKAPGISGGVPVAGASAKEPQWGSIEYLKQLKKSVAPEPSFLSKLGTATGQALQAMAVQQMMPAQATGVQQATVQGATQAVPPPTQTSPAQVNAVTALAGGMPAMQLAAQSTATASAAQAATTTTFGAAEAASKEVQGANREYAAVVKKYGAGSPEAEAAKDRVYQAQESMVTAVKNHRAATENSSMRQANRGGSATALYDNGYVSLNVVQYHGRGVLVATIGGETFEVDEATANMIAGKTVQQEQLTNLRLERNMVLENYERAKYDRDMTELINGGSNEALFEAWKSDPYNKRAFGSDADFDAVVARVESLRPFFSQITPEEFAQQLEDMQAVAQLSDLSTIVDQDNKMMEMLSKRMSSNIKAKATDNGYTIKHIRSELEGVESDIAEMQQGIIEAKKNADLMGVINSPEVAELEKQYEDILLRKSGLMSELGKAEQIESILRIEEMSVYSPVLGSQNILAFSSDTSDFSPMRNIAKTILYSNGFYDAATKSLDAEGLSQLSSDDAVELASRMHRKAHVMGWTGTPEMLDAWIQQMQYLGAESVDAAQAIHAIQGGWQQTQQQQSQQQQSQQQQTQQQPKGQWVQQGGQAVQQLQQVPTAPPELKDIADDIRAAGVSDAVDKVLGGNSKDLTEEDRRTLYAAIFTELHKRGVPMDAAIEAVKNWGIEPQPLPENVAIPTDYTPPY